MKRLILLALCLAVLLPLRATSAEPSTWEEVLSRAEERFAALTDYQCTVESDTQAGKRHEAGVYQLWFKKPHLLRLHVLRGRGGGSDVVQGADGKVRGRKGGLLKPFVIRMEPDDRRLRSIRGTPVVEMDWGSFYRALRERSARPGARVTLLPHAGSGPYEIQVTYPAGETRMREAYRLDPAQWVMVEGDVFEDETRVDHVVFKDVKLDTGLSAGFFRL